MQFINTVLIAASALATIVSAENFVQFVNQDSNTGKNIVFTPNAGLETLETLHLEPSSSANQTFPDSWIGNFFSYDDGADNVPGMLGEVRFQGYSGATFFDISSIVNPEDVAGIKMLYPFGSDLKDEKIATSGCQSTPCTNQYNAWNDVATQSTPSSALTCLVGQLDTSAVTSVVRKHARHFVTS